MSKSMLVIDTPECCGECKLSGTDVCRKWSRENAGIVPPDCILKAVPEKKLYNGVDGITGVTLEDRTDKAIHEAAALGWNACIEEILKESD